MKTILKIFGIIDFISIIIFLLSDKMKLSMNFFWMSALMITVLISMIFSAFFLYKNKVMGIWIYYLQFIPRLIFWFGLSFGFLSVILDFLKVDIVNNNTMFVILSSVEVMRLIITIFIHKKMGFKPKMPAYNTL